MPVKAYAAFLEPEKPKFLISPGVYPLEIDWTPIVPPGITTREALDRALQHHLFEPNDAFTRAKVTAEVQAHLNQLKAEQKIYDFSVVCEESNNPYWAIDQNELRADIYIKPTRSLSYIQLSAISTRGGIDLESVLYID